MGFKLKQWLLLILLPLTQLVQAQYPKNAACSNPSFDKKVHSLLNYSVPVISVEKAFKNKDNIIFLDARENEEYQISHLPKAQYIGYDNFDINNLKGIDKNAEIVVYCSIGYRSEKIGKKLQKAGYKNVKNLYGSIFEWVNVGYPIYDHYNKPTQKIHTYNKKWSQWVTKDGIDKVW